MSHLRRFLTPAAVVALAVLVTMAGTFLYVRSAYIASVTNAYITQPITPYSYTLGRYNSSHYYAQNYTGYGTSGNKGYEFLASNFSDVFNDARSKLSGTEYEGTLFIREGDYSVTQQLLLGRSTQVQGEAGTILSATAALGSTKGVLTIDSTSTTNAKWAIRNLEIDLNGQTGHGIYSYHASTETMKTIPSIENVLIEGVLYGYAGIYFRGLLGLSVDNVHIYSSGFGVRLVSTSPSTFNAGNTVWNNLILIPQASNFVGIYINGVGSSRRAGNQMLFSRLQVGGGYYTGYSNITGVWVADDLFITFTAVDIEGMDRAFYLDNADYITIQGGYILTDEATTSDYGVYLLAGCQSVAVSNIRIQMGGCAWATAGRAYWDDSGSTTLNNVIENLKITNGTFLFDSTTVTGHCAFCTAYNTYTFNYNWGNSTGTAAAQTIAHGLFTTPTHVWIQMRENATSYPWPPYVTSKDMTNIEVVADLGLDYTWFAEYRGSD